MKNPDHSHLLKRLNRIEGQLKGVSRMIDDGRYCIDILTQTKAIHAALRSVETDILETHMHTCVTEALSDQNQISSDEKIEEILNLFKKEQKS